MTENEPREDQLQAFENGQDIRDRTLTFACRVVEFCKELNESGPIGRGLSPQLLSAATSVAAMLEEARAAESTRDFVSKCCISLKECREAHVRLQIIETSRIGSSDEARSLRLEANELVSIITVIVRNTKRNAALKASRSNGHRRSKRRANS